MNLYHQRFIAAKYITTPNSKLLTSIITAVAVVVQTTAALLVIAIEVLIKYGSCKFKGSSGNPSRIITFQPS